MIHVFLLLFFSEILLSQLGCNIDIRFCWYNHFMSRIWVNHGMLFLFFKDFGERFIKLYIEILYDLNFINKHFA